LGFSGIKTSFAAGEDGHGLWVLAGIRPGAGFKQRRSGTTHGSHNEHMPQKLATYE
jgi:hypothetical protein